MWGSQTYSHSHITCWEWAARIRVSNLSLLKRKWKRSRQRGAKDLYIFSSGGGGGKVSKWKNHNVVICIHTVESSRLNSTLSAAAPVRPCMINNNSLHLFFFLSFPTTKLKERKKYKSVRPARRIESGASLCLLCCTNVLKLSCRGHHAPLAGSCACCKARGNAFVYESAKEKKINKNTYRTVVVDTRVESFSGLLLLLLLFAIFSWLVPTRRDLEGEIAVVCCHAFVEISETRDKPTKQPTLYRFINLIFIDNLSLFCLSIAAMAEAMVRIVRRWRVDLLSWRARKWLKERTNCALLPTNDCTLHNTCTTLLCNFLPLL